jgi:hypothetical protein
MKNVRLIVALVAAVSMLLLAAGCCTYVPGRVEHWHDPSKTYNGEDGIVTTTTEWELGLRSDGVVVWRKKSSR